MNEAHELQIGYGIGMSECRQRGCSFKNEGLSTFEHWRQEHI